MFTSFRMLRKSILTLIALAVFFWTVILPAHFPHNRTITQDCSCHQLLNNNDFSTATTISASSLDKNNVDARCPLCVLSSMFSLALIIEDSSSIITYLKEGSFSPKFTFYSFNDFDYLKARAPPTALIF